MERVSEHALTLEPRPLGEGGQGRIFQVTAISGKPPRDHLAVKKYRPQWQASIDSEALHDRVRFRRTASTRVRRLLRERMAWPQTVVEGAHGQPVGFLMRLIPDEHLQPLHLPGNGEGEYCQLQHLLNDDAYLELVRIAVPRRWRVEFLHDIAETIATLHRHGVTVGDLSPLNIYPGFGRGPRCFFVDCDAMAMNGRSVLPQAQTPGWETPDGEAPATVPGDTYKVALLATRLFAGDQETRDTAALSEDYRQLGELAQAGLSREPSERPAPARWVRATRAAGGGTNPFRRLAWRASQWLPRRPARTLVWVRQFTAAAAVLVVLATVVFCTGRLVAGARDLPGYLHRGSGQAREVDQLLTRSGADNTRIASAIQAVASCRGVRTAIADIDQAREGRASRLAEAQRLDVDGLLAGEELKTSLEEAMRTALAADEAYLRWARRAAETGCRQDERSRTQRAGALRLAEAAAQAKQTVVKLWNRIAERYGYAKRTAADI